MITIKPISFKKIVSGLFLFAILICGLAISGQAATPDIGYGDIGSQNSSWTAYYAIGNTFTANASVRLASISAYMSSGGGWTRAAIYATDASGNPTTLLSQAGDAYISAEGWASFTLSNVVYIYAGEVYYLAVTCEVPHTHFFGSNPSSQLYYQNLGGSLNYPTTFSGTSFGFVNGYNTLSITGIGDMAAPTRTPTPMATSTYTPAATSTPPPATSTYTPEATSTPPPATSTYTPEATSTPPPPTSTPEPTAIPTNTPLPTVTFTQTTTFTITRTITVTSTVTQTGTITQTATATPIVTATPTATTTVASTPRAQNNFSGKSAIAYPNPARDKVTIALKESLSGAMKIRVFNMSGEKVTELVSQSGNAVEWITNDVAPGIYLYQVIVDDNLKGVYKLAIVK